MNGNSFLLDTNIVLYLLASKDLTDKLLSKKVFVSFVTELELLSYPKLSKSEEESINYFLEKVSILDLSPEVKSNTINLRKKYNLTLPDAIICATSLFYNLIFVSNDKKLTRINELKSKNLKNL